MKIPRYWAKSHYNGTSKDGKVLAFDMWGWSAENQQEAEALAQQRARQAFDRAVKAFAEDKFREYDYLATPLREEIVEALILEEREIAVVTRNRYGSLVLNAASACFIDIDFPSKATGQGLFGNLLAVFSSARREQQQKETQQATIQKVSDWLRQHPECPGRLYRTAAGLRLLLTGRHYDPQAAETTALLKELGSDPLYRRLTEKQGSFRARLTPKHWRCNCPPPPTAHPWPDPHGEAARDEWVRQYTEASRGFRTCDLLGTFGRDAVDSEIRMIVDLHDRHACNNRPLPLA
jgi:hypothetical protein